jgi:hypothetical protein
VREITALAPQNLMWRGLNMLNISPCCYFRFTDFCKYVLLNLLKIAKLGHFGLFVAGNGGGEGAKRIKTQKSKQAKPDLQWGVIDGGAGCFDLWYDQF